MRVGMALLRRIILPAVDPNGYPFDLEAADKRVRWFTGVDFWPWPAMCGFIMTAMPQFWPGVLPGTGMGKLPFGPGTGALPVNLQWQTNIEGLTKVQGQVNVG